MNILPPDIRNGYQQQIRQASNTVEKAGATQYVFSELYRIQTPDWVYDHTLEILDELEAIRKGGCHVVGNPVDSTTGLPPVLVRSEK